MTEVKDLTVSQRLRDLVGSELEKVDQVILKQSSESYSDLIPEITKHIISAGGKRIRPILTLISARMCGYRGTRHLNLAGAVEYMHTATLLHDDVVDKSASRRGKKTANQIWGNKASVLVGDFLLGRAFQLMVGDGSIKVLKTLSNAAATIAEGEVLQLGTSYNIGTERQDYIKVIEGKTAALFAAACKVGGQVNESEKDKQLAVTTALRNYGYYFGLSFQMADDALDFTPNNKKLGKNIGDDLKEGKMTLPIIYSYQDGDKETKNFWEKVMSDEKPAEVTEELINEAIGHLQKNDSINKVLNEAKLIAEKAIEELDIFPSSEEKDMLIDLAKFVYQREN